jgi:hypothetical protein
MGDFIANIGEGLKIRWIIITIFIFTNFIVSVLEAIKLKNLNVKKLPEFIKDWLMSIVVVGVIEVVVQSSNDMELLLAVFRGLREIALFCILVAYLKKIVESLRTLGFTVNIGLFERFMEDSGEVLKKTAEERIKQTLDYGYSSIQDDLLGTNSSQGIEGSEAGLLTDENINKSKGNSSIVVDFDNEEGNN